MSAKINLSLIAVFLMLHLSAGSQTFVYSGDTAFLSLNVYKFGHIQWQQSDDTINWLDIPGATGDHYPLLPQTSRYYRAKVTSGSCNPFYSSVKHIQLICFQCGDTLIDYRDGQKYLTVLIGTQCWMAKNLNVGQKIDNGTQTPSDNNVIEKYCYNNDTAYCETYGGLYDWNEMMQYTETESSRGICPCGWHIPGDYEWIMLERALGMDSATAHLANTWRGTNQGTQLKVGGSSGYDALLSGSAIPGGIFNVIGQYEYMHTSTPFGVYSWRRCVRTGDATVGRWNTFPRSYGLSLRCVKD